MGAWDFVDERIMAVLAPGQTLRYVGRAANASPATGSHRRHHAEQEAIVEQALAGSAPASTHRGPVVEATPKKSRRTSVAAR